MTTQSQAVATLVQAMTAHANREIWPCVHQNSTTMASHLRDFTKMNPPMFFASKIREDHQDILDDIYKILIAIWVT